MSHEIFSLAYVSRSELSGSGDVLKAEIRAILASSRRNNHRLGVTGALLYSEGWFAQILEGPVDALESLFETIGADRRHSNVTILHFHPVEEPSFPAWSMAYAGLDPAGKGRAEEVSALSAADQIPATSTGASFVATLHDFISCQEQGLAEQTQPDPAPPANG